MLEFTCGVALVAPDPLPPLAPPIEAPPLEIVLLSLAMFLIPLQNLIVWHQLIKPLVLFIATKANRCYQEAAIAFALPLRNSLNCCRNTL
jgi:hypothetical protein